MAFDIDAARRTYRRKQADRDASRRARWERARTEADRLVAHIVEHYAPRRVIQWGSVLRPDRFTEISDIDVAVEGIDDPVVWSALERDALRLTTLPVDLVRVEALLPEQLASIMNRGTVVYERE